MEISQHEFEFEGQRIVWYRTGNGATETDAMQSRDVGKGTEDSDEAEGSNRADAAGLTGGPSTTKPTLVILHGWGSEAKVFFPLCRALSDLRSCLLIDFPGFGKSEALRTTWQPETYARLVDAWLEKVAPGADILVHSFGNRILLRLLADGRLTNRLGKIIVTGGAGLKPRRSLQTRMKRAVALTATFPARLMPTGPRQAYHRWVRTTGLWKAISSADYARLEGPMRETFVRVVNDHLDALLPRIRREMLLLWGEHDTATPVEQGRRLEKGIEGSALVVIKGAGHYAFLDKPGEFHTIVRSYLSS